MVLIFAENTMETQWRLWRTICVSESLGCFVKTENKMLFQTPQTCSILNLLCISSAQHLSGSRGLQLHRCFAHVFCAGQITWQKRDFCFHTCNLKCCVWDDCDNFTECVTEGFFLIQLAFSELKKGLTGHRTNGYWSSKDHVWLLEAFLALLNTNKRFKKCYW